MYVPPEGHTQSEHTVAPLVVVYLPAVQDAHVSAVAAAHVSDVAVLLHEYCEDARLPLYPALHAHVIWYGSAFDVTVAPLCTALAGALMAEHAMHPMEVDHVPNALHDEDVGAWP